MTEWLTCSHILERTARMLFLDEVLSSVCVWSSTNVIVRNVLRPAWLLQTGITCVTLVCAPWKMAAYFALCWHGHGGLHLLTDLFVVNFLEQSEWLCRYTGVSGGDEVNTQVWKERLTAPFHCWVVECVLNKMNKSFGLVKFSGGLYSVEQTEHLKSSQLINVWIRVHK